MQIIELTGGQTIDDFHSVPKKIYDNDPNWIPQLRAMIENTFDRAKNKRFQNGDATRWVLKKNGELIGRIAAFYDPSYSDQYEQATGCCGYFECIDDQRAAKLLFDTARDWLKSKGLQAMDGPVNFDENFFYWGLLTDGFRPQTFGMQYNPPYYLRLFENYGFRTYYRQYSYSLDITNPDLPDRFWKIAGWVAKKPGYVFEHFSFKEQDRFIRDFIEIHQKAWGNHGNYKPLVFAQVKELLNNAKILLDEDFIWYVYHKGKPIAFFMQIKDLNQVIGKPGSGNPGFWHKLRLFFLMKTRTITRCRVIVLGVIPGYQGKGIESGIFHHLKQVMLKKHWYNDMEMSWVGDFNPKMNALFSSLGADHTLTHRTMRYLFDREKEFTTAPIIE